MSEGLGADGGSETNKVSLHRGATLCGANDPFEVTRPLAKVPTAVAKAATQLNAYGVFGRRKVSGGNSDVALRCSHQSFRWVARPQSRRRVIQHRPVHRATRESMEAGFSDMPLAQPGMHCPGCEPLASRRCPASFPGTSLTTRPSAHHRMPFQLQDALSVVCNRHSSSLSIPSPNPDLLLVLC